MFLRFLAICYVALTVAAGANSVRDVDFKNFTYDWPGGGSAGTAT